MQLPLQVTFQHLPHSDEVEDIVYENASRLDGFCDQIMSCRVVVDMPHRHHRQGNLYQVRVDITVPGEELVVNREAGQHTQYKDLRVAIDDAFNTAARLLEDYARRHRLDVKAHQKRRRMPAWQRCSRKSITDSWKPWMAARSIFIGTAW